MLLDSGVGALSKVLEAYKDEAVAPTNSTRSILDNYALGCYSVATITQ